MPTVLDKGRPSIIAIGERIAVAAAEEAGPVGLHLRLSHRLAVRRSPDAPPRFPARPARAAAALPAACPGSARYSVATNIFMKAGCATSSACGASTSSA